MVRDLARTLDFRPRHDDPPKPRYIRKKLRHLVPWLQRNSDERIAPFTRSMPCVFCDDVYCSNMAPLLHPTDVWVYGARIRLRLVESACRGDERFLFFLFSGRRVSITGVKIYPRNMFP